MTRLRISVEKWKSPKESSGNSRPEEYDGLHENSLDWSINRQDSLKERITEFWDQTIEIMRIIQIEAQGLGSPGRKKESMRSVCPCKMD